MIVMLLKDIEEDDLDRVLNWRNQSFIREMMFCSELIDIQSHRKWFQNLKQDSNKHCKLFIFNEIPYGIGNFTVTSIENEVGEWGFYIGEPNAPKGIGSTLGYTFLNFIFDELKIRKVCAEVIVYNEVSLYFHRKLGFTQDGILRKHIKKNGEYYDVYLFSLLAEEWQIQRDVIRKKLGVINYECN